ncbi:hypothetical protein GCM10010320_06120 [Streptomyces caelestis]|nr:hypothetical protein GCM10010320_06120 [Streptomyces caelestis]
MVHGELRSPPPDDLHEAIKAAADREWRSQHGRILRYLRLATGLGEAPNHPEGDSAALPRCAAVSVPPGPEGAGPLPRTAGGGCACRGETATDKEYDACPPSSPP